MNALKRKGKYVFNSNVKSNQME